MLVLVSGEDGVLLSAYRHEQHRRGLNAASSRRRAYSLESLAAFVAPRSILDATRDDVQGWLDTKRIGPKSRNWHVSNLACFYRWAALEGHGSNDPTARIARAKVPRALPRPMAQEDLRVAIGKAEARTRCWLLLAAFAGLRVKEIAELRRDHVLDTATPPVLIVVHGKGERQRVVPLHPDILDALREHGLPSAGFLWPGGVDGHLARNTITRAVSNYLRDLGISATAHQGRHYFASAVYQVSHDLRLTQELLGHADPRTTAQYAAWDQSQASEVVGRLEV